MSRDDKFFDDDNIIFACSMPILVSQLNYGNHLDINAVGAILHETRMRWLKSLGLSEINIGNNTGFMILEQHVFMKSQGFYADNLGILLYPSDFTKRTFAVNYKIIIKDTDKVIALGINKLIFYNFKEKRVSTMPDSFKNMLLSHNVKV